MQRCEVTNNPCGTDTRPAGQPCLCTSCVKWLAENQQSLDPEFERVLYDNLWDLYETTDNNSPQKIK